MIERNLERNEEGVLVNTNRSGYEAAVAQRHQKMMERMEINTLKQEIEILKQRIEKLENG